MTTWLELYERQERLARELQRAVADAANYIDDEEWAEVGLAESMPRNRLRFDDSEGMAQQSTSHGEAISASPEAPSWANGEWWVRAPVRLCAPACRCPCSRCAYSRWRIWAGERRRVPS